MLLGGSWRLEEILRGCVIWSQRMWTYLGNIFGIAESQISKFFLFLFYVKFQANDYQEKVSFLLWWKIWGLDSSTRWKSLVPMWTSCSCVSWTVYSSRTSSSFTWTSTLRPTQCTCGSKEENSSLKLPGQSVLSSSAMIFCYLIFTTYRVSQKKLWSLFNGA